MTLKFKQFLLILWQYLNQPLEFSYESESIWNLNHFWYFYQLKLLEACWYKASVLPSHENRGQDGYKTEN